MNPAIDFVEVFARLARDGCNEKMVQLAGTNVRTIRVKGGGEGRWDHHGDTAETVIVWSGSFTVEFRDRTLHLSSGQCYVVPVGAEHRGISQASAEVILFQQAFKPTA